MNNVTLILTLSTLIWYIIDRLKPLWAKFPYSKYITMGAAAALSTVIVLIYSLDLVVILGIAYTPNIFGEVMTIGVLMGGSSAMSEFINKMKVDIY